MTRPVAQRAGLTFWQRALWFLVLRLLVVVGATVTPAEAWVDRIPAPAAPLPGPTPDDPAAARAEDLIRNGGVALGQEGPPLTPTLGEALGQSRPRAPQDTPE